MENIFKTTTVLILLFTSIISFGTNREKENQITIKNQSGEILYQNAIDSNTDIVNAYNYKALEDGLYSFEITKDYEIKTKKFVVANHEVTFLENTLKKSFKPVFRQEDERVFISHLALNPEKELKIKIYFEDELIRKETLRGAKILNRVYRIKENISGTYTVVMTTNNRIYKESFKI